MYNNSKENQMKTDIAVIGGGAAGMAVSLMIKQLMASENPAAKELRIVIIEKEQRVGRKLLATGNGACNISNIYADDSHYHSTDRVNNCSDVFSAGALSEFSPQNTVSFFSSLGLECQIRSDGRIYPLTAQASAVLDCMRLQLAADNVEVLCGQEVTSVNVLPGRNFVIKTTAEIEICSKFVIIAAGGLASPGLGGSRKGYKLLQTLGIKCTSLSPAIVQIKTETEPIKALQGIKINGSVSLVSDNRQSDPIRGEILFTAYGVSGPPILQLSREVGLWEARKAFPMYLVLDLLPDLSQNELYNKLCQRRLLRERKLDNFLTGLLNKRLGQTVLKSAKILPLNKDISILTDDELLRLSSIIKNWRLQIRGTKGWSDAQVTAGGIYCSEIDSRSMQLYKQTGMYVIGEIIDIDGDCGGYNLQWAWSSAWMAAKSISHSLLQKAD